MHSQFFVILALFLFSLTVLGGFLARFVPDRIGSLWFRGSLVSAVLSLSLGLALRSLEAGHLPLANLYESLLVFAWFLALVPLFIRDIPLSLARWTLILSAGTLLGALLLPERFSLPTPLLPALKSRWLSIHVLTCFSAYAAFTVAFGSALFYLFPRLRGSLQPESLEVITTSAISVGFPLLTLGIVTGAVWANQAWGTYWSWDPKETWSLITWFIYAAFLHARFARRFRGRRAALLAVIGFLSVIFTYLGVNLLLSGLHSYG